MAVLGLRFCVRAFSSCGKRGPLFIAVHWPLTIAASLVAEHRLRTCRLSNCGSRAQLPRGMRDLPRPGLEPMSPAWAGRLSTIGSSGKPSSIFSDHNAIRLEMNYREKTVKNTNTWRLKNMLLNNQEITEEIKEEIKKYLETNDKENTMIQNLWDAAKAVLRGKFIAIQAYLKKQEKSQVNNLTLHLKELEKRRTNKTQS